MNAKKNVNEIIEEKRLEWFGHNEMFNKLRRKKIC